MEAKSSRFEEDCDYIALFNAAPVRMFDEGDEPEAEVKLSLAERDLVISLSVNDGRIADDLLETARSVLSNLAQRDTEARSYLYASSSWPYEEEAVLSLIIIERSNAARFCYEHPECNDEQVVGYKHAAGTWRIYGLDYWGEYEA
jgi:hypothetical protein